MDTEKMLFDGVDHAQTEITEIKLHQVRSKKQAHAELSHALETFIEKVQQIRKTAYRSTVKQSLLARNASRPYPAPRRTQPCAEPSEPVDSLESMLDTIFVEPQACSS